MLVHDCIVEMFPDCKLAAEVLMEDGELITFGQGASGRLGTGKMANRYETFEQ